MNSSKNFPYKYGEVVCETDQADFVKSEQARLVEYHGYKCGDRAKSVNTGMFAYVLVISDEYYADVEYRFKATGKILTLEEVNEINRRLV